MPLRFHSVVVDGLIEADARSGVTFQPAAGLDASAIGEVQATVRRRLLRAALRLGLLSADHAQVMAEWEYGGGFLVDAQVRIEAHQRDSLERLLRYCAHPAFALERLREIDTEHLVYESVKPGPGGSVCVMLTPMQRLDRLAALIPPPRKHRHRTYGLLAPNSPQREAVTALAQPTKVAAAPTPVEPIPPDAASAAPIGIALFSRHPLQMVATVRDAQAPPHLEAQIAWQGRQIHLLGVHPMPPLSAHFHAARNAKLARWATVIAGDLNAPPWSTAFNDLDALGLRRATGLAPPGRRSCKASAAFRSTMCWSRATGP